MGATLRPAISVVSGDTTIPIFVISLSRSSRGHSLRQTLTQFGIPFENVDAVDGFNLDSSAVEGIYNETRTVRRMGRPMGRGEIGNALSHRKVCRMILDRHIEVALILEEDAIIKPSFKLFWQSLRALPAEVNYLSLYAESGFVSRSPTTELSGVGLHPATYGLTATVGYVMRPAFAREFLDLTTKIEVVTDWPLNRRTAGHYLALPMPLAHGDVGSVIGPERKKLVDQYTPLHSSRPAWLRALFYLTYVGFLVAPYRYDGLLDYYWREVAGRLKYIFSRRDVNVAQILQA